MLGKHVKHGDITATNVKELKSLKVRDMGLSKAEKDQRRWLNTYRALRDMVGVDELDDVSELPSPCKLFHQPYNLTFLRCVLGL